MTDVEPEGSLSVATQVDQQEATPASKAEATPIVAQRDAIDNISEDDSDSDLDSAFDSSQDTEDHHASDAGDREALLSVPDSVELRRRLMKIGPAAFLREYLYTKRCSILEMLIAFDIDISADITSNFEALALLRQHIDQEYCTETNQMGPREKVSRLLRAARHVMVITGAGISTSLGIPDFRSENGIYSQLSKYNLSDPQEMFDIEVFHHDPSIFYDFCKDLLPNGDGRYSATHAFIRTVQDQGKLLRLYTQNIDNIESYAGIDEDKLVQCHGSFRTFTCVTCSASTTGQSLFDTIRAGTIPKCNKCCPQHVKNNSEKAVKKRKARPWEDDENSDDVIEGSFGVMKPDMTFFGEQLPSRFKTLIMDDREKVDLVICIGTSLKVQPVAAIPRVVAPTVPQIFISKECAARDCIFDIELLGACDEIMTDLAERAGWSEALESVLYKA